MDDQENSSQPPSHSPPSPEGAPPVPVSGVRHIFAATRYSAAGLASLMKETAFRLELCGSISLYILFALIAADAVHYLVLTLLFLGVFCIEALNTAIELIVNEISPHRSEFARKTKDLGSLAVACMLLATALFAAYVVGSKVLG